MPSVTQTVMSNSASVGRATTLEMESMTVLVSQYIDIYAVHLHVRYNILCVLQKIV